MRSRPKDLVVEPKSQLMFALKNHAQLTQAGMFSYIHAFIGSVDLTTDIKEIKISSRSFSFSLPERCRHAGDCQGTRDGDEACNLIP